MHSVFWFRRDLRLGDNPGLARAAGESEQVSMLYVHAPQEEAPWAPGGASRWYLHQSLGQLEQDIARHGQHLTLAKGDSLKHILAHAKEHQANRIYWNRVYEPAFIARDQQLKKALQDAGYEVIICHDHSLFPPGRVLNQAGGLYKVFTPFWRTLYKLIQTQEAASGLYAAPFGLGKAPMAESQRLRLADLELLDAHNWHDKLSAYWNAGEAQAAAQLNGFDQHLQDYPTSRNLPATRGTSGLSAALHFGEISPWRIFWQLQPHLHGEFGAEVAAGAAQFVRQIGWREFAIQWLYHRPDSPLKSIQQRFDQPIMWNESPQYLKAWTKGKTGFGLVDAGMHELWRSGTMHNRVRMVTASLLTKNLGLHWRHGASWFWDTLVDADLANNTMGWQWVAGCGCDAAPYYRIFNPERQAKQYDAAGEYQNRWLGQTGLSDDPIVDLGETRQQALARYAKIKSL